MSNKKYTKEQIDKAKELWTAGQKVIDISVETGIKVPTLKAYVLRWKSSDLPQLPKLSDAVNESAQMLHEINMNGLRIVRDNFKQLKTGLTPKEVSQVVDVLKDLNKFTEAKKDDEEDDSEVEFNDYFGE